MCCHSIATPRCVWPCPFPFCSLFFFARGGAQPLVRHAALYAARVSESHGMLNCVPWAELLFDDSMWVHREAHAALQRALALGALENGGSLLDGLFGNAMARPERALIALVGTLLREPAVRDMVAPYNLVAMLMERFVIGMPMTWECGAALEVFAEQMSSGDDGDEDDGKIRAWFRACLDAGVASTAVMLAAHCRHDLQEQMLPDAVQAGGPECALPLVKRMRPNAPSGLSVCLMVLRSSAALEKWQCMACGILQSWDYAVADEALLLQLLNPRKPRLLRLATQLASPHWGSSQRVRERLSSVAAQGGDEWWPLVWECVARHSIASLVDASVEAFCATHLPSDTKLRAWFSLIPFLGPSHPHMERVLRVALARDESIAHVGAALALLSKREWSAWATTDMVWQAVLRCLCQDEDDSDAALAALAWIRTFPRAHPEATRLVSLSVEHSARAVRQATWQLLQDCGPTSWPQLQSLWSQAPHQVHLESANEVYGDPLDSLGTDPMLDREEPDCCE